MLDTLLPTCAQNQIPKEMSNKYFLSNITYLHKIKGKKIMLIQNELAIFYQYLFPGPVYI